MKIFFRPEQNVSGNISFSPSAGKPHQFVDYLKAKGLSVEIDDGFSPLTRAEMSLAHDPKFVNSVLDLHILNGFGNKLKSVADSLPYTSGSFLAAAREALKTGFNACSPTSGFHHAGYDFARDFCTFNGLVIAAQILFLEKRVKNVAIIDCDEHYGNGTDDIIKRLKLGFIRHYTFGGDSLRTTRLWARELQARMMLWRDVDVFFYQAGADPHIDDPLGGSLTTHEMKMRDELVFRTAWELGKPVVWNLAGGYQQPLEKVLELHQTTYEIGLKYSGKNQGSRFY